jgi:hypothetical protein
MIYHKKLERRLLKKNKYLIYFYYKINLMENSINDIKNNIKNDIKNDIKCFYCNGNHLVRNCLIEKKESSKNKKNTGKFMEQYYANNFCCYRCQEENFYVLNNRSPSLDIICKECNNKIEIKSKCLSVDILPDDLLINSGSYKYFINRINENLDLVIFIYKVNRITKDIIIREILYFTNYQLKENKLIKIIPKEDKNISIIYIPNRNDPNIIKLSVPNNNIINTIYYQKNQYL